MSFSDFKKRSQNSIEDLTKKIEETESKKSYKDDRFWRPQLDKASNGYAVIRFLPAPTDEDIPWAKLYSHAFQGKGGWFIENSRTTLGEKDPVSEANNELWNSGIESDKDIARQRKRKLQYISNILVVSDPTNPENDGKVFLYKFGKKIFDKIQEAMSPEFDDEEAINPFDFWKGGNFKLKVRKVAGYVNYDKSEFDSASELFGGDDEQLEELWKKEYSLVAFTDSTNFKSYDDLKERFNQVVGTDIRSTETQTENVETETASREDSVEETESNALDYFQRLADE
tara:strand:+ start:5004 stop:5858 length:855 start_codon:yes stop_codon:yes gene_type:complete